MMAARHTGVIGRAMVAMVDAKLPVNAQILDIACGVGAVALPALERAA
jgi:ubiquinone/menaquinone biosynthesis C-methylase UbiE